MNDDVQAQIESTADDEGLSEISMWAIIVVALVLATAMCYGLWTMHIAHEFNLECAAKGGFVTYAENGGRICAKLL